jgi:hypothetical protein
MEGMLSSKYKVSDIGVTNAVNSCRPGYYVSIRDENDTLLLNLAYPSEELAEAAKAAMAKAVGQAVLIQ